jgi:4-hydroxybenzoate polyprenyltransferase
VIFLKYLIKRFNLPILLILSLLSNLCLSVVLLNKVSILEISLFTFINLSQLFFLRVLDDYKDYKLDKGLHPDRLISQNKIRLRNLFLISFTLILISLGLLFLASSFNFWFIFIWLVFLGYNYLLVKNFLYQI